MILRHILFARAFAVGSGKRNVVVVVGRAGRRRLDGPDSGEDSIAMAMGTLQVHGCASPLYVELCNFDGGFIMSSAPRDSVVFRDKSSGAH